MNILTGLNNPTRLTNFAGFVFGLVGFNSGQNNGRLIRFALDTEANNSATDGAQPKTAVAAGGSPLQATFTNPFDVVSTGIGGLMFVTDGFNVNNGGRVLAVVPTANELEFTITNLTANAVTPQNPAFLLPVAPSFLFVSEFGGNNVGQVRRINLADPANPVVEVFANNLTFPADLVTDGEFLFIAEAGNNAVVRIRLDAGNLPVNAGVPSANVTRIQNDPAAQIMRQPFELAVNDLGDVYVEEGMGLALGGLPPLGTANGQIQIIRAGTDVAVDVGVGATRLTGITNPSGLDLVTIDGGQDVLLFTESVNTPNGLVRAVVVNQADLTVARNTQLDTGLNQPFDVITGLPQDVTRIFYTVNFEGGPPNGLVRGGGFE